jgi:hypothetical protein
MFKKTLYQIHDSHSRLLSKTYIPLLVRCHLYPIWPLVLPLNIIYVFIFVLQLSLAILSSTYVLDSHVHFSEFRSFTQRICPCLRPFVTFCNKIIFYGEELFVQRSSPLSAVRNFCINTFAAALHIWRPSPPSAAWRGAMPTRQATHLTWLQTLSG